MNSAAPAHGSDVEAIILGFAAQEATGCLTIADRSGDEGLVWFRDGQVYAVSVPGRRPLLGVRLVTAGAISPEQLNSALHVQRTEMPASRLGEVLVHLGLVNRRVIENFALEQQRDMLAELLGWKVQSQWFRNGAHTRTDLAPFTDVADLIEEAHVRQQQWPAVVDELGGADVVPIPTGAAPHASLAPSETVVLRLVDGVRTLSDIADECGYTVFEAADVMLGLIAGGLVTATRDLLDTRSPSSQPDTTPYLAEVLELHPTLSAQARAADRGIVGDDEDPAESSGARADFDSQEDEGEPLEFVLDLPAPTTYGLLPDPLPTDQLPPPSSQPMGQPAGTTLPPPSTAPVRPTDSDEPADTAALLRELTSLGDLDGH